MKRLLVDASTLIALASCGRLSLLRDIAKTVTTTAAVASEVLVDRPGAAAVRAAIDSGWIKVIGADGDVAGLGRGEAGLIVSAKAGDVVVLDDRAARLEAKSRGVAIIGLLGLIVHGARTGKVKRSDARRAIDDLAKTNFRMSADLYRWAVESMDGSAE